MKWEVDDSADNTHLRLVLAGAGVLELVMAQVQEMPEALLHPTHERRQAAAAAVVAKSVVVYEQVGHLSKRDQVSVAPVQS